jgi:hypothetical protein
MGRVGGAVRVLGMGMSSGGGVPGGVGGFEFDDASSQPRNSAKRVFKNDSFIL